MTKITINDKDFVSVPEAAGILGKPKMTLYRWIAKGKILWVTMGRAKFIPKSEVDRLKKELASGG